MGEGFWPSYELDDAPSLILASRLWLWVPAFAGMSGERVVGVAPGFRITRCARVRNDSGGGSGWADRSCTDDQTRLLLDYYDQQNKTAESRV